MSSQQAVRDWKYSARRIPDFLDNTLRVQYCPEYYDTLNDAALNEYYMDKPTNKATIEKLAYLKAINHAEDVSLGKFSDVDCDVLYSQNGDTNAELLKNIAMYALETDEDVKIGLGQKVLSILSETVKNNYLCSARCDVSEAIEHAEEISADRRTAFEEN